VSEAHWQFILLARVMVTTRIDVFAMLTLDDTCLKFVNTCVLLGLGLTRNYWRCAMAKAKKEGQEESQEEVILRPYEDSARESGHCRFRGG
jgi:hypothetical protein